MRYDKRRDDHDLQMRKKQARMTENGTEKTVPFFYIIFLPLLFTPKIPPTAEERTVSSRWKTVLSVNLPADAKTDTAVTAAKAAKPIIPPIRYPLSPARRAVKKDVTKQESASASVENSGI